MPIKTDTRPPLEEASVDNNGPLISIITFIAFSVTFIIVIIKTWSMVYLKRVVLSVDIPIWTGTIVALLQSLLIQFAVDHGLGRHFEALLSSTLDANNRLTYTAQLLFFVVLSLTKISSSNLILSISPTQSIEIYCRITQMAIAGWTVLAIFGSAFQCQTPRWQYYPSRCLGEGAIMYPIMTINMLVDLVLVALPTAMLWNVQMPLARRVKLIAAFASRIIVVVVDGFQISYLGQYLHSTDPTWSIFSVTACNHRVMMNASIITTCIPNLYRVMNSLALGMNRVQIPEELELSLSKKSNGAGSGSHGVASPGPSFQAGRGVLKVVRYPREAGKREDSKCVQSTTVYAGDHDRADSTERIIASHRTVSDHFSEQEDEDNSRCRIHNDS
ncbi:integral membrane protein [Aspergillus bombycis]|uniref:Integral membrane protein n=1 Tax=Aspergillus bombycis TaxID=109264 RepID=A0A1F8A179_9EURO|nr:integral membrane protein [Aspergillus bombycis]OGM45085.1 integral membrane protein [Aspergillus bombycis]